MKKYTKLNYGFTAYTGKVWTDLHIDEYNRHVDRINRCIEEGYAPSEEMLNRSHKLFAMFSRIV